MRGKSNVRQFSNVRQLIYERSATNIRDWSSYLIKILWGMTAWLFLDNISDPHTPYFL